MKPFALLSFLFFTFFSIPLASSAALVTTLFSPEDRPTKQLIEFINGARKSIHASVYLLTDKTIAQSLIDAKTKRKVDVKIIIDTISTDPKYGKADFLVQNGVDVFIFEPRKDTTRELAVNRWSFNNPIMHNKFAIFDATTVWTGSFNWTVSANVTNCENVVIIKNNKSITEQYQNYFSTLLETRCSKYDMPEKHKGLSCLRQNLIDAIKSSDDDAILLEKLMLMVNDLIPNTPIG